MKKFPRLTKEYLFLMVMRPETYAARLQRKNPKHQIKEFEIKEFQKDLRKKTFKIALTSALTIMLVISLPGLFTKYFAQSKGYQWIQTSWVGGPTSPVDTSTNLLTGWTKYFSKSKTDAVTADATGVKLANVAATNVTETGGSYSGSLTNGSGMYPSNVAGGAYVAGGNMMNLKKPSGATCTTAAECAGASSICTNSTCCVDACCGTTSVAYNSDTYNTVPIGTQCWFAENLRTPKKPDGTALTLNSEYHCYTGDPNCASSAALADANGAKYGVLYTWTTAMNGSASVTTAPGPQGICPTGWHIPTKSEIKTLEIFLGMTQAQADATGWRGTDQGIKLKSGGASGFNFPLAGSFLAFLSTFDYRSSSGNWWSSTLNTSTAWTRSLSLDYATVSNYSVIISNAYSVRCVKN